MGKINLPDIARRVQKDLKQHYPEILTGIGISGMIATTIMAVRATPKAIRLIEKAEKEKAENLSPTEKVKTTWKCYAPATVTGALSVACLIGASSANAQRNAALATAYTLSETALQTYREKVVETIGEKKEQIVRDSIAKDKLDKNPISRNEVIITSRGDTLCYDVLSGRYFKSDIEKIRQAVNRINYQLRNDSYISLNEFYDEIGLDHIKLGDELGWHIDYGYLDLDFSAQLSEDGTPCMVIDYQIVPRYEYRIR